MASPLNQLYKGDSWAAIRMTPPLKSGLIFQVLAFVAIRPGSFIAIPGVDGAASAEIWHNSPLAHLGGLF